MFRLSFDESEVNAHGAPAYKEGMQQGESIPCKTSWWEDLIDLSWIPWCLWKMWIFDDWAFWDMIWYPCQWHQKYNGFWTIFALQTNNAILCLKQSSWQDILKQQRCVLRNVFRQNPRVLYLAKRPREANRIHWSFVHWRVDIIHSIARQDDLGVSKCQTLGTNHGKPNGENLHLDMRRSASF